MSFGIFQVVVRVFSAKLWYVPLLASAMALMFLRLAIVAHMLPVSDFAAYSAGLLVSSSFCMLACFGLQSLLQRDLPILIVHRRERAGEVLIIQCVMIAAVSAVVGLLFITAIDGSLAGLTVAGLSVSLFHGLAQQLFIVATVDSRSRNQTVRFARQNLERAVPLVIAGPSVISLGGGPMAVLIAEAALTMCLCAWLLVKKFRWSGFAITLAFRLGWRRMPNVHWRSAITLLAVSSLSFVVLNADRWIAARWLPTNDFGQYAFAWTLFSIAQSIQLIVNSSVYPILSQKYASYGRAGCFSFVVKLSLSFLVSGIILSGAFFYITGFFINDLFPKYSRSLMLFPIFLIVVSFRISDFWSSFLIVTGQEMKVLLSLTATTILVLCCWLLYLKLGIESFSLTSIAGLALLITLISYIVMAFLAWRNAS
jgi:O-antigen/teichoic acid export membrane protein